MVSDDPDGRDRLNWGGIILSPRHVRLSGRTTKRIRDRTKLKPNVGWVDLKGCKGGRGGLKKKNFGSGKE